MTQGYTAAQVRAAEEPHLAAGEPLMARAAHGLAVRIRSLLVEGDGDGPAGARDQGRGGVTHPRGDGAETDARDHGRGGVLLLVGSGDNGGDALFAGAELAAEGVAVEAVGVGSRMHEAGWAAAERAGVLCRVTPGDDVAFARWVAGLPEVLARTAVVVDGMLGTGTSSGAPALRGRAREAVEAMRPLLALARGAATRSEGGRAAEVPVVVAVDLPSGVDPDSGATADDVVLAADVTVTFGGVKAGLLQREGARLAGVVELVRIGIEDDLALERPAIDTGGASGAD